MATLDDRWVARQSAALLRLGVNPMDVERSIKWMAAHLPDGADPDTWTPTGNDLWTEPQAQEIDSRANWYVNAPTRFQRLLDAR